MRGNDNDNNKSNSNKAALQTLSKMKIFFFLQTLERHKNRNIFSAMVFWTVCILCLLGAIVGIALALARDADMPEYYNVFMTGTVLTSTRGTHFIFSFQSIPVFKVLFCLP